MKERQITQLYTSPEVEVLEVKTQQIVCASTPNSTDSYELEDW